MGQPRTVSVFLAALLLLGGCGGMPPEATTPLGGNSDPALDAHFAHWAGTPYSYGGSSPAGVDCSGFVQASFAYVYGVQLPRTTHEQRRSGRDISPEQLQAGDLVFFSIEDRDSHVGIYLGDGQFMHASSRRGVVRDRLGTRYWWPRLSATVRVLSQS